MMADNLSIQPKGIKVRRSDRVIEIEWESGDVSLCSFALLRKNCPCAECRSERTKEAGQLLDQASGELTLRSPTDLTIKSVQVVGNYALQLEWSDGHMHGIYTWDFLRALCNGEGD